MGLKLNIDAEAHAALDAGVQKLYKAAEGDDGGFVLDVDDMPDISGLKSALQAERTEKKALKKELTTLQGTWAEYDKEDIDSLIARRAELDKVDPTEIERQINARVQQNDAAWKEKYEALNGDVSTLRSELSNLKVRDALRSVGAQLGVGDGGQMDDFVARGERIFKMNEKGEVQPLDAKGELTYGKDGVNPLTMDEFAKGLAETAPHLFKPSSGGGASNDGKGGSGTVRYRSDLKTTEERVAFISEHGRDKYLDLPAEAPKQASA